MVHQTGVHCMVNEMLPRFYVRLDHAFGFLAVLLFTISRSLENPDIQSDKWNSQVESYESAIWERRPSVRKGRPPGCCPPELYLGFENSTSYSDHDNRVTSVDAPCSNYADMDLQQVQFRSVKLAKMTDAITIAVWVNLQTIQGIQPILVVRGQHGELRFEVAEGHVTWLHTAFRPPIATFALISNKPVVETQLWTHIVALYDAHNNRAAVFVNGKEILQGPSAGGSLELAWNEIHAIGRYRVNKVLEFKLRGLLDEFYIYFCALPNMVIQRFFRMCHIGGKCAPSRPGIDRVCDVGAFLCWNRRCIRQEWKCDGENDCGDWSDEIGCDGFCAPGEKFSVFQGRCTLCFCMGRSQNCSSANVYRDRITLKLTTDNRPTNVPLVGVDGSQVSGITYTLDSLNNELSAHSTSKGRVHFWALPKEFLGNKLTSYGGKLRYAVKYISGNASTDTANVPSRKVRSAEEILTIKSLMEEYATGDVRDVDDNNIDVDTDASGTEDPSLDMSEHMSSTISTQFTSRSSRVKEIPFILPETNATSKHTISTDGTRNVTENPGASTAAIKFSTERTRTQRPSTPTIHTGNILITENVETTPTVEVDRDTNLNTASEDGGTTKRVFSSIPSKSELPVTTATQLTTGKTLSFQTTQETSDRLIAKLTPDPSLTTSNPWPESRKEATPTVFFSSLSTPKSISEAIATTQNTYDTTTNVSIGSEKAKTASSTYSSDSPSLEMVTTIPDKAYTTSSRISSSDNLPDTNTYPSEPNAPNSGQDGPSTILPYSTYSTRDPATEMRPPETFSTSTSRVTEIEEDSTSAAAVPSSAYTTMELIDHSFTEMSKTALHKTDHISTEGATTEYVTVPPRMSETTMITSSGAKQEMTNTVSVSPDGTDVSTLRTDTKPNTFHSTTDESTITKSETTGIINSSQFSVKTTSHGIRTISSKTNDNEDATTTATSPLAYSNEQLSSESLPSVTDSSFTKISPNGENALTTSDLPSAHITHLPTTQIPDTSQTERVSDTAYTLTTSVDDGDETTYIPSSSDYQTDVPFSKIVTSTTDPSSMKTSESTNVQFETSATMPPLSFSTERPPDVFHVTTKKSTDSLDGPSTASVHVPSTSYKLTDSSTAGKDEATTSIDLSVVSSERPSAKREMTIALRTDTTSVDGQDETTSSSPSSAYSNSIPTSETRINGTVEEMSTNVPPTTYSSNQIATEYTKTVPGISFTERGASTDGVNEKIMTEVSSSYIKKGPPSESLTTKSSASSTTMVPGEDGSNPGLYTTAHSTVGLTSRTTRKKPNMSPSDVVMVNDGDGSTSKPPPSDFSTVTTTVVTESTIPNTLYTKTKASTGQIDGRDEKATAAPATFHSTNRVTRTMATAISDTVYSKTMVVTTSNKKTIDETGKPTSESVSTVSGTSSTGPISVDGDDETTTDVSPSAYSTDGTTSRTVTNTPYTVAVDGEDVLTTTLPPSGHSTDTTIMTTISTIPETIHASTKVLTDQTGATDGRTTTMPSTSYSTDRAIWRKSATFANEFYTKTMAATIGDVITVDTTEKQTTETLTTVSGDVTPSTPVTQPTAPPPTAAGKGTEAVRIMGRDGSVILYHGVQSGSGNYQAAVEIKLIEEGWISTDGVPVSRDSFMRVLSDVQGIFIRASYGDRRSSLVESVSIKDVSLDVASQEDAGYGKALLVEKCECSKGYDGLSCEYCSPGYTRTSDGLSCKKCSCNGHSDVCDQENGTCFDCRYNTEGSLCDRCRLGYFGNALRGTPADCKPCPCPLTISPNQFSPTCFLDSDDLPTCDACPVGYSGRNCELCAINYTGDPMIHYSKCELAAPTECDTRGSLDTDSDARKCLCKLNVRGDTCDTCKPGSFNLQEDNLDGCTPCFCNGVSDSCQSAMLNKTQIRSTFSVDDQKNFTLVTSDSSPVNSSDLFVNPLTKELTFQSFVEDDVQEEILYWKLPQEYTGNKLTSYGGYFSFVVSHEASSDGETLYAPDIILIGRDITLHHYKRSPTGNDRAGGYQVIFEENSWIDNTNREISRNQLMKALHHIEALLIRASYNTQMLQTTLREVSMDTTTNAVTNKPRVSSVEQCVCPAEYQGLSCESCKAGYYRSRVGPHLGKCIKCDCNGHSLDDYCDPETGECKNCQYNTEGFRCHECVTGFYGNATIGQPSDCKPCPCPMTSSPNRFSPTCFMAEDNEPTCDACPPGYGGRKCDRCVESYVGNPTEPGGKCNLVDCRCDVRGSINSSCDPITTQCFCKKHVEGSKCDSCKRSFFNLQSDDPQGCVPCFCFGVSAHCKCADYYKEIIPLRIALLDGPNYLRLSDLSRDSMINSGYEIEGDPGHYVYDFGKPPVMTYYWFLGEEFRGDMITSYDGILRYTVSHEMQPGGELTSATDVQLRGRGIVLIFHHRRRLKAGEKETFGLKLSENWLRYPDNAETTRDTVMTVLSAVDSILVRATYSTTTTKASLYGVKVETAVPQVTRFRKAEKIEQCRCPPEYTGTSCQRCARGYTRTYPGPEFSPCVPCSCNQHSKECDPETGQCVKCDHNTAGSRCETCAIGFYGDATKGTPQDCQPCSCPLTVSSNQFSKTCKIESDGLPACTGCQTGYTGRTCNRCAKGYSGNPNKPGRKCIKLPAEFLPSVMIRPMKRTKTEGDDVRFYCFAKAKQQPLISWSRGNGKTLPSRAVVSGKILLISKIRKEDEGDYACTARNIYGSETGSTQLRVQARRVDPISVTVSPKVLHVLLDQKAQFTCRAKSVTEYTLQWTQGVNGALPNGAENENGVLTIERARAIHGGSYTCTGKNANNEDMVTVQLRIGVTKPQVLISPASLSVQEGDSAQFRCSASGFPAPELQWHGGPGGELPPEASTANGNGLLIFDAVKKIHEGEYFCTASNLGGISSTGTFLNVSAPGTAPIISVEPSSLTVLEGEEASFQCSAIGDPKPTIRWSREKGQLPPSSTSSNGFLRIFPTKLEDGGDYVCTAANTIGVDGYLVTLTVERDTSVPPTALVSPANQTVLEGSSTSLSCQVTGDPYPSIEWRKVGGELPDNHSIIGGLLVISEISKEDEGMYLCLAQNKKGVKQVTAFINVRSKVLPKIEIMPARRLTVTGGETVIFRCVVKAGNPPPAVVWETEESQPLNSSDDGVLVISPANGNSQGKYICKATNVMGSAEAVALLIVQGEPNIITTPSSPVSATTGNTVTLECAAAGDPPPSVEWISPESSRSSLQIVETRMGVLKLTIEDVRLEDQGNYTCQATNIVGIRRESVQLLVTVANEPPEVVVETLYESVIEGYKIVLRCNSSGVPTPSITWERVGSNLPSGALNRNGNLIIPSVAGRDAGIYACKAVNVEGEDVVNVQLEVIAPPQVEVTPSQRAVIQGDSLSLFCVATPLIPVIWSKINGSITGESEVDKGKLIIKNASVEHAGKYRCQAFNAAGSDEDFAIVTVVVRPTVTVSTESMVASPNSNVTFRCNASGIPEPVITWTKGGMSLPRRHSSLRNKLTLTRIVSSDEGRYICTATNAAGYSQKVVYLSVEDFPSGTITGGSSVTTVAVGGSLTLECQGTGIPEPEIMWSRVDGPLPNGVTTDGGLLNIVNAQLYHGGPYVCNVTNKVGSVQSEIVVLVQEAPKVTVTPQKSRVKLGETGEFTCIASGSPLPKLTWRKLNGSVPIYATVSDGVLRIPNVTHQDAGIYFCDASNVEGSAQGNTTLEIKVTVPRFTQRPLSYLSVPTLTKEPLNFTVEIVFTPEMADGLIFYNDQFTNGSVGDFISFGMSNGFAEFRFNLGFEPAIIRSHQPLRLYEWHSVILSRNGKVGNLTVDSKSPVTGISKGGSTGLNLNQDLYIGGVPDFLSISTLAGFKSGFIGCLSYLMVDGNVVNLGDPINHMGLGDCNVCETRPCNNGGTCEEVPGAWGFVCSCRPGYSGRTCQDAGQQCSPGVCNEGRCENIGDEGFKCICPAGYSGERCEEGALIETPMFDGHSFMSFPGIEGALQQLKLVIRFMIHKSGNMLLLYNGQRQFPQRGDFISLAIIGGKVEFRFDLGSGPGIVRSARNITVGQWHTVHVERTLDEGSLTLDNDPPVTDDSPCCTKGLNLALNLFIGGVEDFAVIDTRKVGVGSGLVGCISAMSVDGREMNLIKSNLELRNITQCTECLLPCEIEPCLNNATCLPIGKISYSCSCAQGYTGRHCEVPLVGPLRNNTCLNNGVLLPTSDSICSCPLGFRGDRCQNVFQLGDSAAFNGNGYLQFPSSTMRGPRVVKPDYMSLEIKTNAENGVIIWQGQRGDHFAIGLREGRLEFRFELGSGPAILRSSLPVNDGEWHSIEVFRSYMEGSLTVDDQEPVNGTSVVGSRGLNIQGSILVGGGENIAEMTFNKYDTGFLGCVRNVYFKTRKIKLQADASGGWNVIPCDG